MNRDENQQGAYAKVNGLDLYYAIHGRGLPVVLLPGGFMAIEEMGELVSQLAEARSVIGVELQGHGHTADIERPLRFESMADDIAALIRHLGFEQADVCGFSLGGGVSLQTAIRHPEVVRKLVLMSTTFKRDGWQPEVLAGMTSIRAETFAGTRAYEAYLRTSPRPEAWPTFVAKMRQLLGEDYDWAEAAASLKTPALILVGDADSVRLAHAVECFALLGGKADDNKAGLPRAQLAILPATTHMDRVPPYRGIITRTQLLLPILTEFLDAPLSEMG